jgi:plastocyanin
METTTRGDAGAVQAGLRRLGRGRRWAALGAGALAAAGLLSACSGTSSAGSGATKTTAASAPVTVHLATVILTGGMTSNPGWPIYQPADFTVPKGATVDMTIYNYDDGTAPLPSSTAMYAKATGVSDLTEGGQPVTSVTAAQVSHTWTVPQLGINVPIGAAPSATSGAKQPLVVSFTFTASKAGTFTWKCMAPCGSGSDGMSGAMATMGAMEGQLTVA